MVLTKTPICNFGEKPHSFQLKGVDNKLYRLEDCLGKNGTLVMFICNHCPYVKAIVADIVDDCVSLEKEGINKNELNREEFLQHAWQWKEKHFCLTQRMVCLLLILQTH